MADRGPDVTLDAEALEALRGYLAFIEARAESLAQPGSTQDDRQADLNDIKRAAAAARARLSSRPSPRVLVVDDQPAIHQLARRILEPEGFDVLSVSDGPAALLTMNASNVSVVLCDIHMPGPTGFWLADRIRDNYPDTAIVFVTGDHGLPDASLQQRGVIGHLVKPFQREQLVNLVREGLRWSDARAAARLHDR